MSDPDAHPSALKFDVEVHADDSLGSLAVSHEWVLPPGMMVMGPAGGPPPKLIITIEDMNG